MGQSIENTIYKNMAKLLVGDGIARIMGFIVTPLLTRIYSPAEMGNLAVFTSFVAILVPFSTLRYPLLVPVLKDDKTAFSLSYATFLMLLCSTILIIISLSFFKNDIFSLFSVEQLSDFWWLIPVSYFSLGLYELFYQWSLRKKEFALLSKSKVLQKSVGSAMQIGLGIAKFGPLGLILGSIFSDAGGLSLFVKNFKKDIVYNYRFIRWSRMKIILKKFVNYPVYRLPAQFLLSLSGKMPLLYFAWKFGAGITGQVGLATTMVSIPVTLLGSSVGKAFYAEISSMGNSKRNEILYITRKVIQKLFFISLIPTILTVLFAPKLFELFFGEDWLEAGVFARILAIYLITQFVYSPISEGLFNILKKQSIVLCLKIIRILIISMALGACYYWNLSPTVSLLIYSIGMASNYILATFIIINAVKYQK